MNPLGSSGLSNYHVASHSLSISKYGFAMDPQDLKFPEIIMNRPADERRLSLKSFDASEIGHQILDLIRGFWSQPGFPTARMLVHVEEQNVKAVIDGFSQRPFYPHQSNMGRMSRPIAEISPLSRIHRSVSPIYGENGIENDSSNNNNTITNTNVATNRDPGPISPPIGPSSSVLSTLNLVDSQQVANNIPVTPSAQSAGTIRQNRPSVKLVSPSMSNDFAFVTLSPPAITSATKPKSPSIMPQALGKKQTPITAQTTTISSSSSKGKKKSSTSGSSSNGLPVVAENRQSGHDKPLDNTNSLFSMFIHKSKSNKSRVPKQQQPQTQPDSEIFKNWIPRDKQSIYDLVLELCEKMQNIFRDEERIVKISAPCLVLGDIHGNLIDLRTYEHTLWPKAPLCCTHNYLFLGDYVDRGEYSVECILYLFAMKSISPKRFFLLRGNHEVAAIQRQYTFPQECEHKFGVQLGRQIWREFNKVFDMMPLAAIVDDNIFCAHGGIPKSVGEIGRLSDEIPCPLDNPEFQCPSAWEILWNDPITDQELVGMIEMDNATINQTQTTQQEESPNGNDITTTTVTTTAISTNEPAQSNLSQAQKRAADERAQRGVNEADQILAREAPEAISMYIRPDDSTTSQDLQQQQVPRSSGSSQKTLKNNQQQSATQSSNEMMISSNNTLASSNSPSDPDGSSMTLRRIPSDTSSVASTSPQQIMSDGFIANIKRGTAYLFSDQAIDKFLKTNRLSHVIRAHEVIPSGFTFHGDGRVITIFSSSKYCGLENQAACALVDQQLIRILRLETGSDLD